MAVVSFGQGWCFVGADVGSWIMDSGAGFLFHEREQNLQVQWLTHSINKAVVSFCNNEALFCKGKKKTTRCLKAAGLALLCTTEAGEPWAAPWTHIGSAVTSLPAVLPQASPASPAVGWAMAPPEGLVGAVQLTERGCVSRCVLCTAGLWESYWLECCMEKWVALALSDAWLLFSLGLAGCACSCRISLRLINQVKLQVWAWMSALASVPVQIHVGEKHSCAVREVRPTLLWGSLDKCGLELARELLRLRLPPWSLATAPGSERAPCLPELPRDDKYLWSDVQNDTSGGVKLEGSPCWKSARTSQLQPCPATPGKGPCNLLGLVLDWSTEEKILCWGTGGRSLEESLPWFLLWLLGALMLEAKKIGQW